MTSWSRFYTDKVCPDCGARNDDDTDETWRWTGDHWEHRCKGEPAQVGHFVVGDDGVPRVVVDQ